jgi:hypothetical protein
MRRVNSGVTIGLAVLAALTWAFNLYRAWVLWTIPPFHTVFTILITACAVLGWILLTFIDARGEFECRCRRCGHILRGLSQPRCPECGEGI